MAPDSRWCGHRFGRVAFQGSSKRGRGMARAEVASASRERIHQRGWYAIHRQSCVSTTADGRAGATRAVPALIIAFLLNHRRRRGGAGARSTARRSPKPPTTSTTSPTLSQSVLDRAGEHRKGDTSGATCWSARSRPAPRPSAAASFSATRWRQSPRPPLAGGPGRLALWSMCWERRSRSPSSAPARASSEIVLADAVRPSQRCGRWPSPVGSERFPIAERRAGALALRHHADRHAHGHHRFRGC